MSGWKILGQAHRLNKQLETAHRGIRRDLSGRSSRVTGADDVVTSGCSLRIVAGAATLKRGS